MRKKPLTNSFCDNGKNGRRANLSVKLTFSINKNVIAITIKIKNILVEKISLKKILLFRFLSHIVLTQKNDTVKSLRDLIKFLTIEKKSFKSLLLFKKLAAD